MSNEVNIKFLQYIKIKWTVPVPKAEGIRILSETFEILDDKCNLELLTHRASKKNDNYSDASLSFIREHKDVYRIAELMVRSPFNDFDVQYYRVTGQCTTIWFGESQKVLDKNVTFEILYHFSPEGGGIPRKSQNIHLDALSRHMSELLGENSSCDIEIACGGVTYKAHRIILRARCTVFSAMLKSNMIEDKTGVIKVEDIEAPIFESFLRYLYSGTLPEMNMDTVSQFYEVGDKYAVEELKRACSDFLTKNLTEDNACEMLVYADQRSDIDFRKAVISYMIHKKIPQRSEQWADFCQSHPSLAIEVQNLYIQKYCSK